jgi:hypothetical protein
MASVTRPGLLGAHCVLCLRGLDASTRRRTSRIGTSVGGGSVEVAADVIVGTVITGRSNSLACRSPYCGSPSAAAPPGSANGSRYSDARSRNSWSYFLGTDMLGSLSCRISALSRRSRTGSGLAGMGKPRRLSQPAGHGPRQHRTPGQEAGNPARRCPESLPHRELGPSRRFGTDGLDDRQRHPRSAHRY